jgi:hypothetical protein
MSSPAESFNKTRAAFMQRASAPNVPPVAFKLAWLIAYKYMNRETQTARPAQETLARDLNVSVRHVRRLADMLEPLGLVIAPGHGPNRSSTYWIDPDKATGPQKRTRESSIEAEKRTPESAIADRNADSRRQKTGLPATENRTRESAQPYKKNQEEEPREESDSRPGFLDSKKDAVRRKKDKKDSGAEFDRFWSVYPRRVAKEAAAKAFTAALKRGIEPETLITGAQRYAVERAGQEPRYTKHPATWLNGGCWEDEAPAGAVIDQNGNVVGYEQPRPQPQSAGRGFATIAEELNAELAATGREWF